MVGVAFDDSYGESAQRKAYRFIRENIISGAYAGGVKLNPSHIASELQISRMPVREALVQLDAEGLVTLRPNRGAVVTSLTAEDIRELFEMRSVLEGLAIREAVTALDNDDFVQLDAILLQMDNAHQDPRLWIRRHESFHDYLSRKSGRMRLVSEISRIRNAIHPYLLLYINVYHSVEMQGAEHRSMLDAVKTRNGHLVERFVRDHVMSAAEGVIQFLNDRRS